MRLKLIGLLSLMIAIVSCSEDKGRPFLKRNVDYQPFLFNMQHYFSPQENSMSFPIWFNDSIIKNRKIKGITISGYPSSKSKEVDQNAPKTTKTYVFNEEGEVLSVLYEQFYEHMKVGSYIFNYATSKDEFGFSKVEKVIQKNSNQNEAEQYSVFQKEQYGEKFLIYKDERTGNYLFYMLQARNWGALSVDSIFNPTINDNIVLGSPMYPVKTYRVENVVNEIDVVEYFYDKSNQYMQSKLHDEYPFQNHRSMNYSKSGECLGFVDSTFSGDRFLKARQTSFVKEEELPIKIIRETKSNDAASSYFQIETLEYSFFERE
ncbi:MAG: hypothetical protein MK105_01705 [Crocinitomicaceae bacterium]|nr:hypothetical protein [Crocinitomicaceae bacterium]